MKSWVLFLISVITGLAADSVPLEISLPAPASHSGPVSVTTTNLEPVRHGPRQPFLVPRGTTNLSAGRKVSCSNSRVDPRTLAALTDAGTNRELHCVAVGPDEQWIQVDLGRTASIAAVIFWHCYTRDNIYRDVVVQISDDAAFQTGVVTIFNNDTDNSQGHGFGKDFNYLESYEGRWVPANGAAGRYVRLYSNGNVRDNLNHYMRVDVYGTPLQESAASASTNQASNLKGFMRPTRIISEPDSATLEKLRTAKAKLRLSSKSKPGVQAPQTLPEAAEFLARNVNMAMAPGACAEFDSTFFFSGGLSTRLETNFLSGLALQKGDTAVYQWNLESDKD